MGQLRESAEDAGRDPSSIELTLSGYLPTTSEQDVEGARTAGANRLVLSASMTDDLAQIQDEMSTFAERFSIASGTSGSGAA